MSYKKLHDETFPASLLMEFDELDDEFQISPPGLACMGTVDSAAGNRSPVPTSNSSSGNYSLSTENENGSGSSSSSNPATTSTTKFRTTTVKRVSAAKDAKRTVAVGTRSSVNQKRAQSMENLSNGTEPQASGVSQKRQQKYGHVKSKVKQYIDEAVSQRGRQGLVRHKSMPETNLVADKTDEIDLEMDSDMLRAMIKQQTAKIDDLQRHLEFCEIQREDGVMKIVSLKRKIEAMRLEESKRQIERDRERKREQEAKRELDRQMMLGAYLRYNRIFTTTSTQTSPEAATFDISMFGSDDSFDLALAAGPSGSRIKRTLQYADHGEQDGHDQNGINPDSATHPEGSPEYSQLTLGRAYQPLTQPEVTGSMENPEVCKECAKKKRKKESKKARLASFFCMKKED